MWRRVTPAFVFRVGGAGPLYLCGYCHLRQKERVFRLDRIRLTPGEAEAGVRGESSPTAFWPQADSRPYNAVNQAGSEGAGNCGGVLWWRTGRFGVRMK